MTYLVVFSDVEVLLKESDCLLKRLQESDAAGQFEWVDSVLVRALKYGHWLLVSNANFCKWVVNVYTMRCTLMYDCIQCTKYMHAATHINAHTLKVLCEGRCSLYSS